MSEKNNGDRSRFSKEDLRMFEDIAGLDINYYNCYPNEEVHPDYALCENVN